MGDAKIATIGRDATGHYYIAVDVDCLYWGRGTIEGAIITIPALLQDYQHLRNCSSLQRLYDDHRLDDPDEYDALERTIAHDYPDCCGD